MLNERIKDKVDQAFKEYYDKGLTSTAAKVREAVFEAIDKACRQEELRNMVKHKK